MYLIYVDEADLDGQREFHIFAAVLFPDKIVKEFCSEVSRLREEFGFETGDRLKFSSGTRPENVTRDNHAKIKNLIIEKIAEFGCTTICYVVPRVVAENQKKCEVIRLAMNTLIPKFEQFLKQRNGQAAVVKFDRTDDIDQAKYFKEVMSAGIETKGWKNKPEHIVSIDRTQDGLSHLCSITDIAVGAFRFVVNEPEKDQVGKKLLNSLVRSMWCETKANGEKTVIEHGLIIRPMNIRSPAVNQKIIEFTKRLNSYLA